MNYILFRCTELVEDMNWLRDYDKGYEETRGLNATNMTA